MDKQCEKNLYKLKKGVDYLKLANLTESTTESVRWLSMGSKVLLGNAKPDNITKLYRSNSPWMLKYDISIYNIDAVLNCYN